MSGIVGVTTGENWKGIGLTASANPAIAASATQRVKIHAINVSCATNSAYATVAGTIGGSTITFRFNGMTFSAGYDGPTGMANSFDCDILFDLNTPVVVVISGTVAVNIAYGYV